MNRAWRARMLAVVAGTAASIAICEIGLRLFAPQPLGLSSLTAQGITLHIPNAHVRYRRGEFDHVIDINSLGLRDRELSATKPPGVFRILVLGDSFTEGKQVGLDDTFAKRLERGLGERFPRRAFEVVNAGVSGYGTADEIKLFEIVGRSLEPELVILAFCVGNDVDDNRTTRFFGWNGRELEERPLEPPSRASLAAARLREFAASHFHLYQFLRYRYYGLRVASPWEAGEEKAPAAEGDRAAPLEAEEKISANQDWSQTDALLDRLNELVKTSGARFLIVAIPLRAQVFDKEWAAHGQGAGAEARGGPQRHLAEFARERGIPFVDLLYPLWIASMRERPYFHIDGHFNARGHAVAAEEILRALEKTHLVGDTPTPP